MKILLALLPFWDPQIPPLGIACLKSYLREHHYSVKTVDANLEKSFRELYDQYFSLLIGNIPENRRGNIFNIGNQVMRNHLVAHLNCMDRTRLMELLIIVINRTFYTDLDEDQLERLDEIIGEFYLRFKDYFSRLLARERPDVLGLSVYGDTLGPSLAAFQMAREQQPEIKTVMGGGIFADQLAPGSPDLDYFVEKTGHYIDKIIIGEGEELFLRLLRDGFTGTPQVLSLKDINSGGVHLPEAAVPDYSDFQLGFYPHLAHYGARSCPYQCKFCSETINWGKYRKKDVAQTVREFIELHRRHSCQLFLMTDSTLNPIISPMAREFLKNDISIYWDGFLRADRHVADVEKTILWRQGGFYRAKLGLESGSQRILNLMNKQITIEQSRKALGALAYAGIKTTTFWLFGFPGETEEDFNMTLKFIEENKDNIYEADCNAFNYYLTGQANSSQWRKNNRGVRLYPEWAREMLLTETWILEGIPPREVAYSRINRFMERINRLGIPNPYSLKDIFEADIRWKGLHKNAVPPLIDMINKDTYISESRKIKQVAFAHKTLYDNEEWL